MLETERARLICVYTYAFDDGQDVRRVLRELVELGLCSSGARPIYYKADAFTHLDLDSDNEYRIRASLFSSNDFLKSVAKTTQDGPVGTLLKHRSEKVSAFFGD